MGDRLRFPKVITGWFAVLTGLAISTFGFGVLGVREFRDWQQPAWFWYGTAMALVFGLVPLAASMASFRSRKIASFLYFSAIPLLALGFRLSDLRDPTGVGLVLFVVLGYFWSIAHRYNWPQIAMGRARLVRKNRAALLAAGVLFCGAAFLTSIHLAVSREFPGDCGYEGTPFVKPYDGDAAFIASVIHVDRVLGSVATVRESFWGLPWWSKILFLKWGREGETYFVDGRLANGLLTRRPIPVVDMKCTGSSPLEDAKVELRLLRGNPDWPGVRIIGKAVRLRTKEEQRGHPPMAGVTILIVGAGSTVTAVTDADGIYDVSGLSRGHYSIHAEVDAPYREYSFCRENIEPAELRPGEVWGCTLMVP